MKLCLVIPTRNRPELAIEAAKSALTQPVRELCVLISDNSASAGDRRALEAHCRDAGDRRLHYVQPAGEMSMPAHWNWALEQALALTDATHFTIQYDRKLWKPGEIASLCRICASRPELLLTYPSDIAMTSGTHTVCGQVPYTGRLYEITCDRVIALSARGMIREMGQIFPVLSNCVVPREVFERIRARFGSLCDSSTPDAAFTYRFCALESRFRYWDRAAAVMHAFPLSNAVSLLSGTAGGTWDDFLQLWGEKPFLSSAPIPDLNLGLNVLFHEYNLVRVEVGEERFPPVEPAGYLRELSHALPLIEDPAKRAEMHSRLRAHGWRPEDLSPPPSHWRTLVRTCRRVAGRLLRSLRPPPPPPAVQNFANDREAVAFLIDHPRQPLSHNPDLEMFEPLEVATGGAPGRAPGRDSI